jgi:L-ascorbate metabolism protein UlaG (beta-lactamase superfamily)
MRCIKIIFFLLVLIKTNGLSQTDNNNSQDSISITYIANAGFLVEMNDVRIVFDSFFKEGYGKYDFPDSSMIYQMRNNIQPFDNIDYIFVSHYHGDHFDSSLLIEYLANNQHTKLFCPNQVQNILQRDSSKYRLVKEQVITLNPDTNSCESINYNDISITACRLWHGEKQNNDIENIGFIVKYKGRCIFHSGDATLADFDGINGFFVASKIDIAILHNSFGSIQLLNITDSLISADNYIFMHLTKDFANMFYTFFTENTGFISNPYVFREAMEKKTYFFNKN